MLEYMCRHSSFVSWWNWGQGGESQAVTWRKAALVLPGGLRSLANADFLVPGKVSLFFACVCLCLRHSWRRLPVKAQTPSSLAITCFSLGQWLPFVACRKSVNNLVFLCRFEKLYNTFLGNMRTSFRSSMNLRPTRRGRRLWISTKACSFCSKTGLSCCGTLLPSCYRSRLSPVA